MKTIDDRRQTTNNKKKKKGKNTFSLYLFLSLWTMVYGLWSPKAYACPACSDLINRGKDALKAMKFGEGISFSIYFMFLIPILLMLSMGFVFYRSYQKSQKQKPIL